MKKLSKGIVFGILTTLGLAIIAVAAWFSMKPPDLVLQGEVEATQVQVASKIPGRIGSLNIRKGDRVQKGQLIATIDSPEIVAKLHQAEAAQIAATAQKEKAANGARDEEIKSAMNVWLRAKAASDLATKTWERLKRLHQDGIIPSQKLDEAEGQKEAAERAESAAKATYDMAVSGARKEDVKSARAVADQASGAVAEVAAYLHETRLLSPINGEVVDIIPEQGELTSPGYPVAVILNPADMWITFNIREDLLTGISTGTVLNARFPALDNKRVRLRVNYVANLGDFAVWRATKASGDFDLKTFEVRAVPVEPIQGLRPGMSAIVDWKKASSRQLASR